MAQVLAEDLIYVQSPLWFGQLQGCGFVCVSRVVLQPPLTGTTGPSWG